MPPSPDLLDRIARARASAPSVPPGAATVTFNLPIQRPTEPGFNDGIIAPRATAALGLAALPAPARAQLRGTLQVLVVLVDFPGTPWSAAANRFNDLFFSTGTVPTGSVHEFYTEVSGGTIGIAGQVVGPFTLPDPVTHYANGSSGMGAAPNAQDMALDAFKACRGSVNFAGFDNDNDGFVDAFVVVHAGPGAEVTGSGQDIWSHKWTLHGGAQSANGKQVYGYLTIPDDAKLGVCAHELGHLLFGWPDLYDTTGTSAGLGDFCLMAGGAWGGNGDAPVHPNAWCKSQQGWITVANQVGARTVTLDDVKNVHQALRLWSGGATGSEYYLLENRQFVGFDQSLPAGDLLVYHVDESQPGNTDRNRYKVGLVQADGKRELENNTNRGDAGDPYPGTSGNTALTPASTPNTNGFVLGATTVSIRNIAVAGGLITFDASV